MFILLKKRFGSAELESNKILGNFYRVLIKLIYVRLYSRPIIGLSRVSIELIFKSDENSNLQLKTQNGRYMRADYFCYLQID